MTVTKGNETVRLNLSLDTEFYKLLRSKADHDYLQVGSWVKQYLMKRVLCDSDNTYDKCATQNENYM